MQVTYLTPPAIAKRYGVDAHKILAWIRRGELKAIDVTDRVGGRPRYRISPADLAAFEASRAVEKPIPKIRRRRQQENVIKFF